VGTAVALTGKTVSAAGVFDADNVTYPAVSGDEVVYIGLYQDTGVAATSYLIALFDTIAGLLPKTPDGGDIPTGWNDAGIFSWTGC
jgi:hypothetical protein